MPANLLSDITQLTGRRIWFNDTYLHQEAYNRVCTAKAHMLLEYPFWGYMGLDLVLVEAKDGSMPMPTLCTDGYHIFYNAEFIMSLTMKEVEFAIAHEIYHCVWGHTNGEHKIKRRHSDWRADVWNMATDFVINADLRESGIGEFITTIKILYDEQYKGMSSEEVYHKLLENPDQLPQTPTLDVHIEFEIDDGIGDGEMDGDQEGDGNGKATMEIDGNGNAHVKIKVSKEQMEQEELRWNQTAHQAVASVKNSSKGAGSVPAHLQRLIDNLTKPKLHWKTLIRKFVIAIRSTGYSFVRPDKKTFGGAFTLPGYRRNDRKLKIAVAFDTSGSVSDDAMSKCISELFGIMKSYKQYEIHAFCFDGDVMEDSYMVINSASKNAEQNLRAYIKKVKGGGGTTFASVWNFMRRKRLVPNGLVFFTDGYPCDTNWHKEGRYCPTLFVTIDNRDSWKAPFGATIAYENF